MTQPDALSAFRPPIDADAGQPSPPPLRELAADAPEPPEPGLRGHVIRVTLDDGRAFTVQTSNKDYLRWDKTPPARRGGVKEFQAAPFLFATFLAWSAARRQGLPEVADLTFDAFCDLAEDVERTDVEVPPTR